MESTTSAPIAPEASNPTSDASSSPDIVKPSSSDKSEAKSEKIPSFDEWLKAEEAKKADTKPTQKEDVGGKSNTDATKPPESKEIDQNKEVKPADNKPTTFKIKVNGQEKEVTEPELIKMAQLADAANEKFQKASQIHKQLEQLEKLAAENPLKLIESLKINKEALEKYYYDNHIAPDLMTPEQKRIAELDKREAAIKEHEERTKAEQEAIEKARTEKEIEVKKEHYRQEFSTGIQTALTEANLPINEYTIGQMATYLKTGLSKGLKHITAKDVVSLVKEDMIKAQQSVLKGMDPKALREFLGEDRVKALQEYNISQLKNPKFQEVDNGSGKVRDTSKEKKRQFTSIYDMIDKL